MLNKAKKHYIIGAILKTESKLFLMRYLSCNNIIKYCARFFKSKTYEPFVSFFFFKFKSSAAVKVI